MQVFVLSGADEVLEALEDHQMQLQGMAGMGKFVDFFRQEVHCYNSLAENSSSYDLAGQH